MPLTFNVDGKTVHDPSVEDIAIGLASIDAEDRRSLSIVVLERPPITLCAFGQRQEGYILDVRENVGPKGTQTSKVTFPNKPIPHEQVVKLFQDFARGDDAWQIDYQWEPGIGRIPTVRVFKRLAILAAIFILLVLILKYVLKLF